VIDLFSGWRRAPIESLVDMLRAMHERNVLEGERPSSAPSASSEDAQPPSSAPAAHAAQFVAALLAWPGATQTGPAAELSYDALSKRVLDFQTQARRQKLALERLLGQAFVADDAAGTLVPTFQQTLYLQCPRDGRSAGRFRCVNRNARSARLEVTCESVIGKASGRLPAAQVLFEPATGLLAAGEAMTLQAIVDLTRCGAIDDDEVGAAAEIRLDGDCVLKLWIAVELV
jgi:hypothetical protein